MCSFACYPKKFHHKLRFYYIDFLCYLQTGCALSIKFYQAHRLWFFHFLCCWQMRAFMQHIWHISGARQTLRNKYQVTKLAHRCHLYTKNKRHVSSLTFSVLWRHFCTYLSHYSSQVLLLWYDLGKTFKHDQSYS